MKQVLFLSYRQLVAQAFKKMKRAIESHKGNDLTLEFEEYCALYYYIKRNQAFKKFLIKENRK